MAQLWVNGEKRFLGYYACEEEAAKVVDDVIREEGLIEKKGLNFPTTAEADIIARAQGPPIPPRQSFVRNVTSIYLGISWQHHNQRWVANLSTRGQHVSVGEFACEEAAARAVDSKIRTEGLVEDRGLNLPTPEELKMGVKRAEKVRAVLPELARASFVPSSKLSTVISARGLSKPATSKYLDVAWGPKDRRGVAETGREGKQIYLGSFVSEENAVRVVVDTLRDWGLSWRRGLNFRTEEEIEQSLPSARKSFFRNLNESKEEGQ